MTHVTIRTPRVTDVAQQTLYMTRVTNMTRLVIFVICVGELCDNYDSCHFCHLIDIVARQHRISRITTFK
jgi:hypothetical protein